MRTRWLEFRVENPTCDHESGMYEGCILCETERLRADIALLKPLCPPPGDMKPDAVVCPNCKGSGSI